MITVLCTSPHGVKLNQECSVKPADDYAQDGSTVARGLYMRVPEAVVDADTAERFARAILVEVSMMRRPSEPNRSAKG